MTDFSDIPDSDRAHLTPDELAYAAHVLAQDEEKAEAFAEMERRRIREAETTVGPPAGFVVVFDAVTRGHGNHSRAPRSGRRRAARKAASRGSPDDPDLEGAGGAPVLPAYADPLGGLRAWCSWCDRWHVHGEGYGHRVAHCFDPESPLHLTGYVLVEADDGHVAVGRVSGTPSAPSRCRSGRYPTCRRTWATPT